MPITQKAILANRTAKPDKLGHGYGKRIIRRVVDKYSGDMVTTVYEDNYEIKVMLALEEGRPAERKEAQ